MRVIRLATVILLLALGLAIGQSIPILVESSPINYSSKYGKNLLTSYVVLPKFFGGTRWLDPVAKRTATLVNMAPTGSTTSGWGLTTRRGGFGELRFDGTNDYVSLGNVSTYDCTNSTCLVTLWFKSSSATQQYLVARRLTTGGGGESGGWFIRLDDVGTLTVRIINVDGNSAGARSTTTTALENGSWYHVAVVLTTDTTTLANNDMSIYINGALNQGSRSDSGAGGYSACSGGCLVTFGTVSNAGGSFLNGAIDDFRFYTVPKSATVIASLYRDTLVKPSNFLNYVFLNGSASAVARARGSLY